MSATTPGIFMRVPGLERRSSYLQGKHFTYWAIFPLVLFHMPSCYLTGRLSSSDCWLSSHGVEMSCSRIPYEGLCKLWGSEICWGRGRESKDWNSPKQMFFPRNYLMLCLWFVSRETPIPRAWLGSKAEHLACLSESQNPGEIPHN